MKKGLTLHVGLSLSEKQQKDKNFVHCPMIKIVPIPKEELQHLDFDHTHVIFTSKTAVNLWIHYFGRSSIKDKKIISVGKATSSKLEKLELCPLTAQEECAEGVIKLLDTLDLKNAVLLWPHAAGARPMISDYCHDKGITLIAPILYKTMPQKPEPLPDLNKFDFIYFSSPSCVEAFFSFFPTFPSHLKFLTIGNITQLSLDLINYMNYNPI